MEERGCRMALRPEDLDLSADEKVKVDGLEKRIDDTLRSQYVLGTKEYEVRVGQQNERVINEIIRRYNAAGWVQVYMTAIGHLKFIKK